mmetsp:Transcript_54759/g.173922  ORF Transcript_54759/g.173922 Transcript_54759/m.173922 type:complete len:454 (+) Transcript_54759:199-1560(+)
MGGHKADNSAPLKDLASLLEPSSLVLVGTAAAVVSLAAHRALHHERECRMQRFRGGGGDHATITIDGRQALFVPMAASCSLLCIFYFFSSVAQIMTAFAAYASGTSLVFTLDPVAQYLDELLLQKGAGPWVVSLWGRRVRRDTATLAALAATVVLTWLISGHWLLNNALGVFLCIAFVSHIRLPNIKVCTLLLGALYIYDAFWVFYSERWFGSNVMVAVASKRVANPMRVAAKSLHLPVPRAVATRLDLPVKLLFPAHLFAPGGLGGGAEGEYVMLGLGDVAAPGMLVALALMLDKRRDLKGKAEDVEDQGGGPQGPRLPTTVGAMPGTLRSSPEDLLGAGGYYPRSGSASWRGAAACARELVAASGRGYLGWALGGYVFGLVVALSAGLLSHEPQPALFYIVPCSLLPVVAAGWRRGELRELWDGPAPHPPAAGAEGGGARGHAALSHDHGM